MQFYGGILAMTLLCGGLGTLLTWVAFSQQPVDYSMLLFVFIFLLLLIITVVSFIKYTPTVLFNDEGIKYAGQRYSWHQIKAVDFTTPKGFPFLGRTSGKPLSNITLTFEEGNELCIYDIMYWNGNQIRNYLQQRITRDVIVQPLSIEEPIDEIAASIQKKKVNRFIFFFVTSSLLLSVILVYLDVSKGMTLMFIIPYNVFFMFLFAKMSRIKKDIDKHTI